MLSVPKEEIDRREAEYQKSRKAAAKPKTFVENRAILLAAFRRHRNTADYPRIHLIREATQMSVPGWIRAALGVHEDTVDRSLTGKWIIVFVLLAILVYLAIRQLLASW